MLFVVTGKTVVIILSEIESIQKDKKCMVSLDVSHTWIIIFVSEFKLMVLTANKIKVGGGIHNQS